MSIKDTKIRVLIVDDSIFFRETLARGISKDFSIEVVGTASDPYMARDMIIDLEPDVMTLDVEMPRMNGIEFLQKLLPQYSIPVVVVSSVKNNVFNALSAGAVDFVTKPDFKNPNNVTTFVNELIIKIKIASTSKVGHFKLKQQSDRMSSKIGERSKDKLIAIGASTGGTEAIHEIIKSLPIDSPGVLIVQHMPPIFTKMYADRLNNSCALEVREAKDGDLIFPGRVLIAPGDFHMKVLKDKDKFYVKCFKGDKVNGHCPSVDVLFNSFSEAVRENAIGIILTGMGNDGAKGLLNMKNRGAYTIGQDEETCVVYGMPMVACNIGAVIKQVPLYRISTEIIDFLNRDV